MRTKQQIEQRIEELYDMFSGLWIERREVARMYKDIENQIERIDIELSGLYDDLAYIKANK